MHRDLFWQKVQILKTHKEELEIINGASFACSTFSCSNTPCCQATRVQRQSLACRKVCAAAVQVFDCLLPTSGCQKQTQVPLWESVAELHIRLVYVAPLGFGWTATFCVGGLFLNCQCRHSLVAQTPEELPLTTSCINVTQDYRILCTVTVVDRSVSAHRAMMRTGCSLSRISSSD